MFPREFNIQNKKLKKVENKQVNGRNSQSKYVDDSQTSYYAKMDKKRSNKAIFGDSLQEIVASDKLERHKDLLRDEAAIIALIASRLVSAIFINFVRVPENFLTRLADGTPITLSKLIPNEEKFDEFLSKKSIILQTQPKNPESWGHIRLTRKSLDLNINEANILGKLYYVALFIGHWDILNNINLTNSGSVTIDGKLMPCIVDWGNCLLVGFAGKSQDDNAFKGLDPMRTDADSLMGYKHAVPFDIIPYLRLPRQLVPDLFDLTADDETSKHMLEGFIEAHTIAKKNFSEGLVVRVVEETFKEAVSKEDIAGFKVSLTQSMFFDNKNQKSELECILKGRLASLEQIIHSIKKGKTMEQIANKQLQQIKDSQIIPRSRL